MLFSNLEAIASRAPASSGLRASGHFQSYADLAELAGRLASGLSGRGIGHGDVVALVLPNGPELFALSYALFGLGAIAMPLNIAAPPLELGAFMRRGGAKAVVGRASAEPVLRAAIASYAPDGSVPLFLSGGSGAESIETLVKAPAKSLTLPGKDDVALYLFSSGSTGLPKVVPHTHGEMLANGRATARDFALHSGDVVFNNLPGNHAMGFLNSVFEVPEGEATTLYYADPNSVLLGRRKILETLSAEGVTVLPGIPFLFDALGGDTGSADLRGVRLVYSAGIGLKRPTFDQFLSRFGHQIRQAYGCTEAGHVAFNRAVDVRDLWNSVGQPVGDTQVKVRAADPVSGLGELMIRSSSVTKGYHSSEDANAAAFTDGWFTTGDLGRVDREGNVYITGRAKLIVEVAGHKVDPIEVEDVVGTHPDVSECVVVGVAGGRAGEQRLKAFIVRRGDVSSDEIVTFCRSRLSAQKVPSLVEFIDAIPKSASGKILRGRLMDG